jgi:intergrase/recombinase
MSEAAAGIVVSGSSSLPTIFTARPEAKKRLRDFFSSHIRNRNTQRAYMEAARQFAAFCSELGIAELEQVEAVHVAAFVERQLKTNSRPGGAAHALRLAGGRPGGRDFSR